MENKSIGTAAASRKPARRQNLRSRFVTNYDRYLEPTSRTLVLSDVDGTILRGSLVLDHATALHEAGTIDLGNLPALWKQDPKNEALIVRLADSYKNAIVGHKASELRIREFIDGIVSDPSKVYSTLERLKGHQAAGHQVVLISGSPAYLVRPFASRFGFDAIGSRYHRTRSHHLTGRVTGMFGAPQKQAAVEKLELSSYETVIGYGDTASDAPLLSVANYSVLVDPNRETLHKLQELKISEILRK